MIVIENIRRYNELITKLIQILASNALVEGGKMSDLYGHVTANQDVFKKILAKVPGFSGYIERQNRRMADKLLRETVANRYEEVWQRVSMLQRDLISSGGLSFVDDLEAAAVKIRQFVDRVRTASYGYSGFFDSVKINENELAAIYAYDLSLLDKVDTLSRAADNVESSIGTDGLPASIRNLTTLAAESIKAFEGRSDAILGGTAAPSHHASQ